MVLRSRLHWRRLPALWPPPPRRPRRAGAAQPVPLALQGQPRIDSQQGALDPGAHVMDCRDVMAPVELLHRTMDRPGAAAIERLQRANLAVRLHADLQEPYHL